MEKLEKKKYLFDEEVEIKKRITELEFRKAGESKKIHNDSIDKDYLVHFDGVDYIIRYDTFDLRVFFDEYSDNVYYAKFHVTDLENLETEHVKLVDRNTPPDIVPSHATKSAELDRYTSISVQILEEEKKGGFWKRLFSPTERYARLVIEEKI